MYRIIPLRIMRRTQGVKFDEIVPSDIPNEYYKKFIKK